MRRLVPPFPRPAPGHLSFSSPLSSVLRVRKPPLHPSWLVSGFPRLAATFAQCIPSQGMQRSVPSSWEIPLKACPGLGTPVVPDTLALAVTRILPSALLTASASTCTQISELNLSRPASSLSTLRPHRSPDVGARLATSLPATALTGLDLHQLDFI